MLDELTLHQIYLQRYAKGVNKKLIPVLRQIQNEVVGRIATASEFELMRLNVLLSEVNAIIDAGMSTYQTSLTTELTAFAEYEAGFVTKLLTDTTTITAAGVSLEQLEAAITEQQINMVDSGPISFDDVIEIFSKAQKREIATKVRAGIVEGKTTSEIARDIQRMTTSRTRAQAEAVVTTLTNHVGNVARSKVWAANSDIISEEKFTAVLDSHTTLTCMNFDGKVFPIGEGPHPALHYKCRSMRVPYIDPKYDLMADTTRAAEDGPTSARTTYNSWLKRQPKEVQDDVLGIERAKLFRSGMHVSKFTDASGKVYTLDELKALQ